RAFSSDLTADRKDQGMRVLPSTAVILALIMMSAPRVAFGQAQSQPAAVAPEHQEMAAKRAKEREKINNCQKHATEQKILPRDRPQFVINCLDGATERNQPSVVAPEYQELAAKRAKEKERVDNCQRQASEQKVLPRDRTQFVISCLDKWCSEHDDRQARRTGSESFATSNPIRASRSLQVQASRQHRRFAPW